jgi:hypothetical protein
MVKPYVLEQLVLHDEYLQREGNSEEWNKWISKYSEGVNNVNNHMMSLWIIMHDFEPDTSKRNQETNPLKAFVYDLLKNDIYPVMKDIRLCHDFGNNMKSIYICNQLLENRFHPVEGKH